MSCIVCTGGGSGGHIFPGLAVAQELLDKKIDVVWIGSKDDRRFLELAAVEFVAIPAGKLRRYCSLQNFFDLFKIIAGFFSSLRILKKYKPALVFSKGGFVSVPPCAAARLLGIPVITHECDFSPGLATRLNALFARYIFVSYPETIRFFKQRHKAKAVVTGNPVRRMFYNPNPQAGKKAVGYIPPKPILLVLGGSLGAQQINTLVYESIEFLTAHYFVVHQVGQKNLSDGERIEKYLNETCPRQSASYVMTPFITAEMPDVLGAASLVLSRAGANSLWEAAAAGKPMILIPLDTGSSRGDQIENARFFERQGAAQVLLNDTVSHEQLCRRLQRFLDYPEELEAAARQSAALAKSRPSVIIADKIYDVVQASKNKN